MIAAAPVAEAAAGRAAAGTAAKRAGTSKAAKAAKKPAAASGTAGVPTPSPSPPPIEDLAAGMLQPPGTKAVRNVGRSTGDAFKSATLKPPRQLSAKDASGFAFGLVLYAMALSGIKHGPPGVTGWLKAKFLNKPMTR